MKVEIIFHQSSENAVFDVDFAYERGSCLCLQFPDGWIRKFPLMNIFSWSHQHEPHMGTRRKAGAEAAGDKT